VKEFWNSKYSAEEYIYGTEPNAYLESLLDNYTTGSILLPGDGEGRNAVYAAKKGWQVTAFDYSYAAKEKAEKLAAKENVKINYFVSDIKTFSLETKFDLISIIYLHLPPDIRSLAHHSLINHLKPGGKIIMECYAKEQLAYKTGGPGNIDLLYSKEILETDFQELNIKQLIQEEIYHSEGSHHQGKASVLRMIAEKN
jgi:SAM-dependent methyltransferase